MRLFPNTLQRDLLKRHIGPFLFVFFTVMFLLLMQFLILNVDRLVGKDLPPGIIIELILTNIAYMVVLAVPMSILVSTLMAFGKFSELNELTALRATGVSPLSMILPVLSAGFLLFAVMVWFSEEVLPEANQKARSLFIDIRLKKPGVELKPNVFFDGIDGYSFLVKEVNTKNDTLYDLTLYQLATAFKPRAYIRAEKGILRAANESTLTLLMFDGQIMQFHPGKIGAPEMIERSNFESYRLSFDMSEMEFSRSDPESRSRSDRTMSGRAMAIVVDSLKQDIVQQFERLENLRKGGLSSVSEPVKTVQSQAIKLQSLEIPDDSTYRPVIDSAFAASAFFTSHTQRTRVLENASDELRSMRSVYESAMANIDWRVSRIAKYLVEVHKKISIPFACIVFVLLGAPIGILTRKGNLGYAAIISAGILTFFFVSIIQGEKWADRLIVSPFMGMWFGNIVLTTIGLYLMLRISTGFSLSSWLKSFSKKDA